MSVLGRLLAGQPLRGDVTWREWDDRWYQEASFPVAAGVPVNAASAQQLTTVSACVTLIADTVATVPLLVYQEVAAGKERATEHVLWRKLRRQPNRWQSSLTWREMMTGHAALRGVAYSEMIGRDRDDLELIPRHPTRVRVIEEDSAGFPTVYAVRSTKTSGERPVPASRMFVLTGPWGGRSPVTVHSEAIGAALAVQGHAAGFFGRGSQPGGLLKGPPGVSFDKDKRKELKDSWEEAHRGPQQSHRVAVLEGGLEWQQVGLSAEDSQLLQSRQFEVSELCRIWRVPPYKVQEYGRATWNNTEQMAIDFLTTCMLPWFRRWEEAISWYLVAEEEPIFAEFLLEGLLRGDTASRYAAYQIATGGRPWMSPNEVRVRENMNSRDGLDEVAQVAQGAAPGVSPGQPSPGNERDDDDDPPPKRKRSETQITAEDASAALWAAWVYGVAESFVKAEDRELETARGLEEKDARRAADYIRCWYQEKYQATVRARLDSMRGVWRAGLPYEAAVATLVTSGIDWALASREPAARKAAILAVLAEGRNDGLAA